MKRLSVLVTLALTLLPVILRAESAPNLDWIIGCWESPNGQSVEAWTKDTAGNLAGFAVDLGDNEVEFFEIFTIRRNGMGQWIYSASPRGAAMVEFKEVSQTGNSIKFSNPSHDFPQEISYQREGARLMATVAATGGENPGGFNKKACD